jgi:hypothetical protein
MTTLSPTSIIINWQQFRQFLQQKMTAKPAEYVVVRDALRL